MKAELFRGKICRFLPNELGDPTFLFHLFKENMSLHDIFKFKNFSLCSFEIFRLIHHYSQILGVSLEPCRRSICLLFSSNKFHFDGNFKTFYCNTVRLS